MNQEKINIVPAKDTETLRLNVRDAIQEYIEKNLTFCDAVDTTCDITDIVFDTLGISEAEQDKIGAKIVVNPRVVIRVFRGCADVMEKEGNVDVEMRDYDTEGGDESRMDEDKNGIKYYSDVQ